ncbi:DUF5606 domain-containing protein [Fulvivirgaceae bacterium PWU4]|uniref:DUF5606 domain-containing protein n=1 Tax=Chryseosolibacter histidini TaxID=2782349 RepID=A0AAP2DHA1_9BACT|nr:DUF5606 domain-containing protein [Chryseosolibacter histidini]MBT1696305.1 DUF5606 domain-containing protein [Chryseosolibacter histidini]
MTLAEIATVSGKGGLFKVVAPTKSGVILESLDEAKTKMIATTSHRLSLLNEISIYTTTKEGTVSLEDIIKKIHKEFGNDLGVDANSDPAELRSFMKSVLPEYDEDRVYISDIKKLVKWYDVMFKHAPEIFTAKEEAKETKAEAAPAEEAKAEPKKESKPKAKKSK